MRDNLLVHMSDSDMSLTRDVEVQNRVTKTILEENMAPQNQGVKPTRKLS